MTIDTYGYEGTTDSVVQDVENQAGVTVNAALDALGDRLASGANGGYAWLIPDLHGNVVGQLNSSGSSVTDAFRYDAYGLTEGTVLAGSIPSPWRFQGKLLESTSGGRDLYDFEARSYSPDIGAFTSLDSVAGSATNPVTLDRYLYAGGNPETLIDPDGHTMLNCRNPDLCGMGGGPGASQAQIAKYLAQRRQEQHRLSSRYGERPGDDERTVASSGARTPDPLLTGGRDQAEDTLTTAQVQSADAAAGTLSCTVHGCTNANPADWTSTIAGVGDAISAQVNGALKLAACLEPGSFGCDPNTVIGLGLTVADPMGTAAEVAAQRGAAIESGDARSRAAAITSTVIDVLGLATLGIGGGSAAADDSMSTFDAVSDAARTVESAGSDPLKETLTAAQRAAGGKYPSLLQAYLGTAFQRAVTALLQDRFPGRFTSNPIGIDFSDATTGDQVELTTPGGVPSHAARYGIDPTSIVTYRFP